MSEFDAYGDVIPEDNFQIQMESAGRMMSRRLAEGVDRSILSTYSPYPAGMWARGVALKDMTLSHLTNCVDFCNKKGWTEKAKEIQAEIDKMNKKDLYITKTRKELFEGDIVDFVKKSGMKIPKSGAGVYVQVADKRYRLNELHLTVEYDETKTMKPRKR